jgi:hypothetical protein
MWHGFVCIFCCNVLNEVKGEREKMFVLVFQKNLVNSEKGIGIY